MHEYKLGTFILTLKSLIQQGITLSTLVIPFTSVGLHMSFKLNICKISVLKYSKALKTVLKRFAE